MRLLDKLERRLGFIAIPGLIRAIVTLNALVFVLVYLNKGFDSYLALDVARIRAGEVWLLPETGGQPNIQADSSARFLRTYVP